MLEADCISHFVSVLQCTRCDNANCAKLLRDNSENLPQPGYVGANYSAKRILLVGQNPGVSTTALSQQDRHYTSALSALRDHPSAESWSQLQLAMMKFVPQWPVSGKHFPLHESGLTLKDIAYCKFGSVQNNQQCASIVENDQQLCFTSLPTHTGNFKTSGNRLYWKMGNDQRQDIRTSA